jgi:hypothetical protein
MGQVSKLNYVDGKLGANTGGQQTTRIVYDTLEYSGGGGTYFEFFKSFQNKTLGQTNLTTNKLDSMESMVIKTISLYAFNVGGSPFPRVDNAYFENGAILTVTIGNQDVVTKLPVQFNIIGQAFDRLHYNGGAQQITVITPAEPNQYDTPCEIRLVTDIVIPPQVSFSVKLELSPGFSYSDGAIVCALAGYGKIFSAGSSF